MNAESEAGHSDLQEFVGGGDQANCHLRVIGNDSATFLPVSTSTVFIFAAQGIVEVRSHV